MHVQPERIAGTLYEKADLDTFFGGCDQRELTLFKTFLMSGFREQEMMHLHWTDIDFVHGVLRVTHKPLWRWTPKAYKEREVPMADVLAAILKDWRKKRNAEYPLVSPTAGDAIGTVAFCGPARV